MWDNNNVIINKKRSSSNTEKLLVNDENFEQLFSISNAVNNYFCGIQAELASKLPKSHHRSSSYEHRKKETFLEKKHFSFQHGKYSCIKPVWLQSQKNISGKISKSLNIIAKLKRHVTVQSIVSVYYALVHPYLTYGCILRGNNYEAPLSH